MFHSFTSSIDGISLPNEFTYPFLYTPHALSVLAADEVFSYLKSRLDWQKELSEGKMFGVLVAKNRQGEIGFLAAFSGQLAGTYHHSYFVPPIYDLSSADSFFRSEEKKISNINEKIKYLEVDPLYLKAQQNYLSTKKDIEEQLSKLKNSIKEAKIKRDEIRKEDITVEELDALIRESQFQKADYKRKETQFKAILSELKEALDVYAFQIEELKKERKQKSALLQQRLFDQFRFSNACGEQSNLCDLFANTVQKTPPSGAGECAAPKLLQYAYSNHYTPIAMAERWWGESPKNEIRKHGNYYPACKGKCGPILGFMLKGLNVEENPLLKMTLEQTKLTVLYEDNFLLVVDKPAGMLSVPGKESSFSVYDYIKKNYPEASGPLVVHRLDMATSGVLIVSKSLEVYNNLQAQFKDRVVKKKYIAVLDGIVSSQFGTITLPLKADLLNRPYQIVDFDKGKNAVTEYKVLNVSNGLTHVAFFPKTGRTHQLRVHAAHQLGLNCPILGDELYGKKSKRLFLHAASIEFIHPVSKNVLIVETKEPF